jgi:eukaryotic-like serine/threonine-protein kinase
MALEVGNRIGDYEILALLGAGGMGRVYKVRNIISNREEAMKVLLPDFASEADLAARFMAEIRTLAGLEHPNIAQLRTAFQFERQFVMIMEYVEGTTLDKLSSQQQVTLDQILEYSMQALSALSYAHSRGVTHRDIKPPNIMITDHGIVKLMDFGIAKSANDMQLTRPGTTMGSVYYMSPEQVRGGTVDARSDIYSFGVTLYEMLTGRKPFQAETSYSVLNAQLNEAPMPPVQVNPAVPQELNNIVLRAMVKAPEGRFQTADEFRNALKALREPHVVQAAPMPVAMPVAAPTPIAAPAAAPAPSPGFAPVAPAVASTAPTATKSHRGLWIGLGAAAAVLALIAAFALLPRVFLTHAGQGQATPAATDTQATPAATDAGSAAQTSTPPADASQANPLSTATPAGTPAASTTATPAGAATGTTATAPTGNPPRAPYSKKKAQTEVLNAGSAAGSSASSESAAPAGPSPKEIRDAHDKYANLDARADAVRQGVQQIRSQQQAQGLDLRGDILASLSRMNNDLREANTALDRDDIHTAHEYMDRADHEIATLESFLGR